MTMWDKHVAPPGPVHDLTGRMFVRYATGPEGNGTPIGGWWGMADPVTGALKEGVLGMDFATLVQTFGPIVDQSTGDQKQARRPWPTVRPATPEEEDAQLAPFRRIVREELEAFAAAAPAGAHDRVQEPTTWSADTGCCTWTRAEPGVDRWVPLVGGKWCPLRAIVTDPVTITQAELVRAHQPGLFDARQYPVFADQVPPPAHLEGAHTCVWAQTLPDVDRWSRINYPGPDSGCPIADAQLTLAELEERHGPTGAPGTASITPPPPPPALPRRRHFKEAGRQDPGLADPPAES